VTWMARASICLIVRSLLRRLDRRPCAWFGVSPMSGRAPSWAVNGMAACNGCRCVPMVLPGRARPIPACRRLPLQSPAPAGMGRGSLACEISQRRGFRHEGRIGKGAARSIPASRPTRDWSRTLTRSMPNTTLRKPTSAAKHMLGGRCSERNTTTVASPAATPTGRPCSGS
jgi:hypothetical protein